MLSLNNPQQLMKAAIEQGIFPGGVLLVSQDGEIKIHEAVGVTDINSEIRVYTQTIFDLASLTKPLGTTLAVINLVAKSKLSLEETLSSYLPVSRSNDKADIKIKHLLAHTSGLKDYHAFFKEMNPESVETNRQIILSMIMAMPLERPIGESEVYSDLGFILLRAVVEEVSGSRLDQYLHSEIYSHLQLNSLSFGGKIDLSTIDGVAATEYCTWRKKLIHGKVHDENTYAVGGVDGQAGLFASALDVHLLLEEIMRTYHDQSHNNIFDPSTLRLFLDYGQHYQRALGFDRPDQEGSSSGKYFSKNSVGHLGFTGTSFWMDLERRIIVILLTNRIHPSRDNERIKKFRPILHDAVMEVII